MTAVRRRVVARWVATRNRSARPLLMHAVTDYDDNWSLCGSAYLAGLTRFYMRRPIDVLACRRCIRIVGERLS